MMNKYLGTLLFVFCIASQALAGLDTIPETSGIIPFNRLGIDYGYVLKQSQKFLESVNADGIPFRHFAAFSYEHGWQMGSGKPWREVTNHPRLGIGVRYSKILRRNELGHPVSAYGFLDGNLFRAGRVSLTSRFAIGMAYFDKKYDPAISPANDIISTHLNVYAEIGAGFEVRLSDRWYLDPLVRISHFSNGNTREPQKGLNLASWSVGLRHSVYPLSRFKRHLDLPPQTHRHELLVFVSLFPRQQEFYNSDSTKFIGTFDTYFMMGNVHLGYNYELNRRIRLSTGIDLIYDGTNGQVEEVLLHGVPDKSAIPFGDKVKIGAFVGWESVLNELSIIGNFGYVIVQNKYKGSMPAFYQRLGFKYHFHKGFFTGLNVRTHKFRVAETLEFNVGMRKFLEK